jgi:hypothetical protein
LNIQIGGYMQLAGTICAVLFGLGSIVVFLVFLQNRQTTQAAVGLLFGAAGLLLTAFFLMPWIQVSSEMKTFGKIADFLLGQVPPETLAELDSLGLSLELNRLIKGEMLVTGWNFANDVPTTSTESQVILFMLPSLALVAMVTGMIILSNQAAAKMLGLFLMVISVVNLGLLFFSLRSIRSFGIDAGLIAPVLDLIGLRLGVGVWMSMLGLVYVMVAGFFIMQMSAAAPSKRPFGQRAKPRLRRSR